MTVTLTTTIGTSPENVWDRVKQKSLLMHVMKPMARFVMEDDDGLDNWVEGKTYTGKSYMLLVIPVGKRHIRLEEINEDKKYIQSREHGEIGLKKWDHLITIEPISKNRTRYTDKVEIDAGIFTLPYFLFASLFYRHRQRRWRKLYSQSF